MRYTVIPIAAHAEAMGIDAQGRVYGDFYAQGDVYDPDDEVRGGAFIWSGHSPRPIPRPSKRPHFKMTTVSPTGIVIGDYRDEKRREVGFEYKSGRMTLLQPPAGMNLGRISDADNHGRALGWAEWRSSRSDGAAEGHTGTRVLVWDQRGKPKLWGRAQLDGVIPTCFMPGGDALCGAKNMEVVRLSGSGIIRLPFKIEGAAWNCNSKGFFCGPLDKMIGKYHRTRAFVSNGKELVDIGTLGGDDSYACGLNDSGYVVGESDTKTGAKHGFLWHAGSMVDLNDLIEPHRGWTLGRARAINDRGEIVGNGDYKGVSTVYLLRLARRSAGMW